MKLRLTLLAAAMATLSAPTFAASALELYGKLNISVQNADSEFNDADKWEAVSNASRLGVKGELAVTESLNAFYQIELEVDSTESAGASAPFKSRNVAAGLQGDFGRVFVGRWDTPLKLAQNKIDLFNDTTADMKFIFNGEARANNILSYSSPKIAGGLVFNVSTLFQETYDTEASTTDDNKDGLFDALSYSVEWQGKDLFLSLAQDTDHNTGAYREDAETTRFVAQYKIGAFQLGGMWQNYDDGVDFDEDGMLFSVAWNVGESHVLKFQNGKSDIGPASGTGAGNIDFTEGGEQTFVGYDYKLAKHTTLFAFYGEQSFDLETKTAVFDEITYLAGGIEVKF
jgi:predicted porin